LSYFQEEIIVKEDLIKIGEEELEKEANQVTVWQSTSMSTTYKGLSTGLSTVLNREENITQIFLQAVEDCRHKIVDSRSEHVNNRSPRIGFKFYFQARSDFFS